MPQPPVRDTSKSKVSTAAAVEVAWESHMPCAGCKLHLHVNLLYKQARTPHLSPISYDQHKSRTWSNRTVGRSDFRRARTIRGVYRCISSLRPDCRNAVTHNKTTSKTLRQSRFYATTVKSRITPNSLMHMYLFRNLYPESPPQGRFLPQQELEQITTLGILRDDVHSMQLPT